MGPHVWAICLRLSAVLLRKLDGVRPKVLLLAAGLAVMIAIEPAGASTTTKATQLKSELVSAKQLGPGWTVLQAASSGTLHVKSPQGTGCVGAIVDDLKGAAAGVTFHSSAEHPTVLHESLSYPPNAQRVVSSITSACQSHPSGVLYANRKPRPVSILYASSLSVGPAHLLVLTGPKRAGYARSYYQFLTAKDGTVLSLTATSESGTITMRTAETYVRLALANLP